MNTPYRESAACPIDHEELERAAFQEGINFQKKEGVKSTMKDWFESEGGKAVTALCVLGVFIVIVLFIARSWPKDPPAATPACQEFRVDTTTTPCTGGSVEPVGGYLVCKCPHTDKATEAH